MLSPEQYEQLVDYLKGNMTAVQQENFEKLLLQDEELREELEWERVLLRNDSIVDEVVKIVGPELHAEAVVLRPEKSSLFYLPLLAAVLIGLVLTALASLLVQKREGDGGMVKTDPTRDIPVSTDTPAKAPVPVPKFDNLLAYNDAHTKFATQNDLPDELANVQIAYAESDYRRVLTEAENISPLRGEAGPATESAYSAFYKGLALLELNESGKAVGQFNTALKATKDQELRHNIRWYKALALLRQNRINDCRKILLELVAEKSTNKRIRRLLDKLPEDVR